MDQQFQALGNKVTEFTRLETFPRPKNVVRVAMEAIHFTSLCPITGQPDFGRVIVTYDPDKLCIESKTMKLYMQTFRNKGVFCEALSGEIAEYIFETIDPFYVKVEVIQEPRGDIGIMSTAEKINLEKAPAR